jgi:methyltransferase (TIGR00027 family)
MNDQSPASLTAQMVAGYRALASEEPNPLFRDAFAREMAGQSGVELAARFTRHFPHMELWIAIRTALIDQLVLRSAADGIRNVVLLGAGLDTRAARLARGELRFFEIDHPATQEEKLRRIDELPGYPRECATYATCNFEGDEDPTQVLCDAGLPKEEPCFVVWEGVTPYLTEDAVLQTATRLAEGLSPKSAVVFDYLSKRLVAGEKLRDKDAAARDEVSSMGEPLRWGSNNPLPLLYRAGFRHVRTVSFEEACLSLTGTYEREREFRFQSMAVASVAGMP